jgi:hypothetical protein
MRRRRLYIFRNDKHLALQAAQTIWVWEIWIDVEDAYLNRHIARQEWQWRRGWWTWRWRRWSHTNLCLPFRSHFPCFLASSPPYTNERTNEPTNQKTIKPKYKPRRLLRLRLPCCKYFYLFCSAPRSFQCSNSFVIGSCMGMRRRRIALDTLIASLLKQKCETKPWCFR